MEKVLKLYKYIDGSNDTPFPNVEYQAVVSDFRYDVKRMGGAPIITCTVMHTLCLDKLWSENVYAYFNGERFFIKQIPTSSYSNTDSRYKHELELVSERFVLDNVYFYDVVDSSENNDKPVSNSSKFSFFGDINEFASRLNQSLQYSNVDYSVVVDDGISSGAKMVSFQDQFFSGAIQEGYNTYNVPFYFEGKVIHFGYTNNAITRTFKYGDKESLLSIQKQNANYKVVNRVTGVGSEDNIPYYYPNDYESKEEVEANGGTWINPQTNLMPSIYRESLGKERFYEALNNAYQIPGSDEYYEFENPYIEGKPKEHIVNFDYIKPTIKGITNLEGLRIDMFKEFAYDANDNDEVDEEGNYLHPYFFAKLRKFDGEHGFNLFDHAIDEQEMVISMTSGSCGACEFIIGVDDETQKNIVQVDKDGNLLRDSNGNVVRSGSPQEKQNDTKNNEVWVALKKDQDTFGVLMPNAKNNYKPQAGDTFVILHIDLPKAYILAAEDKLKQELIKYMSLNNSEKFNFSISFSRIFFAENPKILEQLNENARIQIEYDNTTYELYISSYSYSMSKDVPLPEIRIELSDTLTISQNSLQTAISDVKSEILSSIGGSVNVDILKQGLKYFLRKDKDDTAKGVLSFDKQIKSSDFVQGDLFGTGWSIYKDSNGNTVVETDRIIARKSLEATELVVNQETFEKGSNIFVKGGCTITNVEIVNGRYRCYYDNEEGRRFSGFKVGDQARCQRYSESYGGVIKYYWRLVTSVEEDYVELSMTDCDGTGIPEEGDDIAQLGSRYDKTRQSAIVISPDNGGSVIIWAGIDSFSLTEKNMVGMGVNPNTGRAYLYGYGDMFFGDRSLEKNYITYQTRDGETEPTLNISADIHFGKGSDGLSNLSEFKDIQGDVDSLFNQIEREFTVWYYDYVPTLDNEPAVNWASDSDKALHDQDIFFSDKLARAWRFVNGAWVEITDERTLSALKLAEDAQVAAEEAKKNAREAKDYIDNVLPYKLEDLQNQIDGAIESFFYKYNPTTSNEPASLWVTEEQKSMHLNDTFTNLESGYSWRWTKNGNVYGWTEISDTATVKALVAAGQAQDTADQKRRVFVKTPYTPYDEGDLWVQGKTGEIMRCSKGRASGSYVLSDWEKASKYTDDTKANEAQQKAEDAMSEADAAKQQATAAINRVADVEYLKDTFGKNETIVDGGVYISKLVSVKNEEENIEAFLNGSDYAKDSVHGKLIMAGGIPDKTSDGLDDLQARSKEATTRIYEDGTAFLGNANISGSFNSGDGKTKFGKDGSGQFANGNIRWDSDGTMWKKSPEYIVWRHLEEEYEDGDTIDLQGGSYLDITAGLDYPEYALPSPETDKTIAIRFIHASRSDACAVLTGSFYIGGNDVSKVTTEVDSHTFEIEYRKSTGKWHYYGKYEIINDVVYLLDVEKETSQDNPIIEGLTESIVIYDLYGAHALGFTSGILTNYKYTPTEG